MFSTLKTNLLNRRVQALILACIIIMLPVIVLIHAELSYGGYDKEQGQSVQVYSLRDIWYPSSHGWQPNPFFIEGQVNSYYQRPFLIYPYNVVMEFFIEDVTNNSMDLPWSGIADYTILTQNRGFNVTVIPKVSGDFGDNEGYVVNESESVIWFGDGLPMTDTSVGAGISYHDIDMTGVRVGNRYSIGTIELRFGLDTSLRQCVWSLLLEIAVLEEASLISGHEIQFSVEYTITWVPVLVAVLWWTSTYSDIVIHGDGVTDESVVDYTFFMLEGNIETDYIF